MPEDLRHIHIEYGALRLDYRAGAEQARNVADELTRHCPGITVTVLDKVHGDLPSLPCAALWD